RMRHRPLETHEQSDSGSFETRPLVCLLLQQPQRSTLFPYTTLFRSRLEHLIALLLVDRGRDLLGTLGRTLLPPPAWLGARYEGRSEEHTSELQSLRHLVCRLLLEKENLARQAIASESVSACPASRAD